MRILVVNTDYVDFLTSFYRASPSLAGGSFAEQSEARARSHFGHGDAYAEALRELGHDVLSVTANNAPMQRAWLREHGSPDVDGLRAPLRRRFAAARLGVPAVLRDGMLDPLGLLQIVVRQAEAFRPDVVLNQDLHLLDRATLRALRRHADRIVGQHAASELAADAPLDEYDLVISSFQPTVDAMRARGVAALLSRLAFDASVLDALPPPEPAAWPITFVGNVQTVHRTRLRFLEELARLLPELRVWTPRRDALPHRSILRRRWMGPAYGLEMYDVLRRSFATVNHHGDVAPYANNMRLFEATGVGTLLLTDAKPNLGELFDVGVELLDYRDADDCARLYRGLSRDDRDRIAAAGQARTLRDHTYAQRVRELDEVLGVHA